MFVSDRGPFSRPDLASGWYRSGRVVPGLAPIARNAWCPVWLGSKPDEIAIWDVSKLKFATFIELIMLQHVKASQAQSMKAYSKQKNMLKSCFDIRNKVLVKGNRLSALT